MPRTPRPPAWSACCADPLWDNAAEISSLSLSVGPAAAGQRPLPTRVRLLWDPCALYIRFDCVDDEPYAPYVGRDQPHHHGDVVEVFVDLAGDGREWIEVQVSPTNQVLDKRLWREVSEPGAVMGDLSFDLPGLSTSAGLTSSGWCVELTLPAAGLLTRDPSAGGDARFQAGPVACNLLRYDHRVSPDGGRRLVAMNWSPVPWGQPHVSPEAMGELWLDEEGAAS